MATTFKQKAIQLMVNNGMFESDAAKVFEQAKASEILKSMLTRWNEDVSDYPHSTLVVTLAAVKHVAAQWIAANQPQAWYRPMFEEPTKAGERAANGPSSPQRANGGHSAMATDLIDSPYLGACSVCMNGEQVELCATCDLCVRLCCSGTCEADYPADDPTAREDWED